MADCYVAPANRSFTIRFHNHSRTISGKEGISLQISIYRSQAAAYTMIKDQEGHQIGVSVNKDEALFIGDDVTSPGFIDYEIHSLAPGAYWMQHDSQADLMNAWLVVR